VSAEIFKLGKCPSKYSTFENSNSENKANEFDTINEEKW
jgi:hypothetical protein